MPSPPNDPGLSAEFINEWNTAAPQERTLDVAWFFAPDEAPQQNTRLTIGSGRLLDVSAVPQADQSTVLPVAVIPPLVNPHVHLEFSGLAHPLTPAVPFPDWIRSVIRWRMKHSEQLEHDILTGLAESGRHTVSAIGEITTSDTAIDILEESGQCGVSFRELLGILPDQIPDQLEILEQHLNRLAGPAEAERLAAGISPHATYSVHPELLSAAVDASRHHAVPVAMHIAESADELELLDRGTGRFAEFLQEMNVWDRRVFRPGGRILSYLEQLSRASFPLAVHCNYLTEQEIRFLGQHPEIAVVYCPRTHRYFGHASHPWTRILAAGGSVILGTDGRSSNPDLSIWREFQYAGQLEQSIPIPELIPLITTNAARALGLRTDEQSLKPGGSLSATLIRLPRDAVRSPESLLDPETIPVATLTADQEIVRMMAAGEDSNTDRSRIGSD